MKELFDIMGNNYFLADSQMKGSIPFTNLLLNKKLLPVTLAYRLKTGK